LSYGRVVGILSLYRIQHLSYPLESGEQV